MTRLLKVIGLQGSGRPTGPKLLREVRRWQGLYHEWRVQCATSASLARLSDLELKDIGLHRSEVDAVLRESGGRRRSRPD